MKTYQMPVMSVIELKHRDVIVTSGTGPSMGGGPGNSDDDDLDGDF